MTLRDDARDALTLAIQRAVATALNSVDAPPKRAEGAEEFSVEVHSNERRLKFAVALTVTVPWELFT